MKTLNSVNNFLRERRWLWYRIDLTDGVEKSSLDRAKSSAAVHKSGALPSLRYTEQNPEWVLLYGHVKTGQIHPQDIRHMRRVDLEFLAGMNDSPPGLTEAESAKLRENVTRGSIELHRRNGIRVAVIGAIIGATIGSLTTLLSGVIGNG